MNYKKKQLYPAFVFVFFLLLAVASMPPRKTYQSKPEPCTTHGPMYASPLLVRVYISGSYTMKDLSGAQISGRDYLVSSLNRYALNKYQLADGVTPHVSFNITINEYSSYYGAEVYMNFMDGMCRSNGKYFNNCQSYSRFETNYVTAQKLFDDIAVKYDNFIRNGWCKGCPEPCNPY